MTLLYTRCSDLAQGPAAGPMPAHGAGRNPAHPAGLNHHTRGDAIVENIRLLVQVPKNSARGLDSYL